jgi:hypothetical protein
MKLAILILYILILYLSWFLLSIMTHAGVMDKEGFVIRFDSSLGPPGARISASNLDTKDRGGS